MDDSPEYEEENNNELSEVHEEALNVFKNIQSTLRDERHQRLEDRRFSRIAGAQWEGGLKKYFENKRQQNKFKRNESKKDIISSKQDLLIEAQNMK